METSEDFVAIKQEICDDAIKSSKGRGRKIFFFLIRIGLAAAIISWLINKHYDSFVDHLKHINIWWLLPAMGLYVFHMVVCSWRWYKLARALGIPVSFMEALMLTMKGYFFSLVIPGGAIGGDVAKIGFLSRRTPSGKKVEGAFSILVDRITGMVGLFSIAIIVILSSLPILMRVELELFTLTPTLKIIGIVILLAICVAGLAAVPIMFFHGYLQKIKLIRRLMDLGNHYTHGAIDRMTAAIDTYRDSWRLVSGMCLLSTVLVHLNLVVIVFFIMKSMGLNDVNILVVMTAVTVGDIAGLIPLTLSGIGLRDVTINVILIAGGVSNSATVPILFTAFIVFFNIMAGIFFIFDPDNNKSAIKDVVPGGNN